MQFDWRTISGPALSSATALIALIVDRTLIAVPNPAPLFVCIVAFAGSLSGLASGMISAGIAVGWSALFFLNHRITPGFDVSDVVRLSTLAVTATGTAAITGVLRKRLTDTLACERRHHGTAERLSAALKENLKRRKAQARGRAAEETAPEEPGERPAEDGDDR